MHSCPYIVWLGTIKSFQRISINEIACYERMPVMYPVVLNLQWGYGKNFMGDNAFSLFCHSGKTVTAFKIIIAVVHVYNGNFIQKSRVT